jgi:nucleotide-binding universal stress UspA family protein
MFEKILVAHDGSDGAQRAFDAAVDLAARLQASLHMIGVEEDLPRYAETMLEVDDEKEDEESRSQDAETLILLTTKLHVCRITYVPIAY